MLLLKKKNVNTFSLKIRSETATPREAPPREDERMRNRAARGPSRIERTAPEAIRHPCAGRSGPSWRLSHGAGQAHSSWEAEASSGSLRDPALDRVTQPHSTSPDRDNPARWMTQRHSTFRTSVKLEGRADASTSDDGGPLKARATGPEKSSKTARDGQGRPQPG